MFEKIKATWLLRIIIDPFTGCWVWCGAKASGGYGQVKVRGVKHSAHRAFYEAINGPIPDGLEPDHLCNNRPCVNPKHMEPVTRSENLHRAFLRRLPTDSPLHLPLKSRSGNGSI